MGHLKKLVPVLVILILGFLLYQWNVTHFHLGYWLQVHTGTVNESGPYYGFWSGFGSDLGEYAIISSILAGVYHAARKGNCHAHGCWRIGSLPAADGYKVCKRHHLEVTGSHPTIEYLQARHEAKGRASGGPDGDPNVDREPDSDERAAEPDDVRGAAGRAERGSVPLGGTDPAGG